MFFTASSLVMSVAQLLSGVVIVDYIEPRDMGLWASANLAVTYAIFVLAGSRMASAVVAILSRCE